MSFLEEYKQKLVSADEAVKIVKSGDWVDYGWCTGTPDALDKALARRTDELKDVNVRGGILLKPLAIFEREDAGEHFTWNSWHMGGYERRLIKRGCSFYSPIRYSELPRYYRDSTTPDDVAMFQVAPFGIWSTISSATFLSTSVAGPPAPSSPIAGLSPSTM